MKKGFVLISTLFLVSMVAIMGTLALHMSSYEPRLVRDLYSYVQASLILDKSENIAKYLLYTARKKGFECIKKARLEYPLKDDTLTFDYVYPLAKCENGFFTEISKDQNPLKIVMVNVSVAIKTESTRYTVNESVFLRKSFFLYPKDTNSTLTPH